MLHVLCCFAQHNFCFFDALVSVAAVPCILNSLVRAVRGCYTAVFCWKVIHFIVVISFSPERETSNKGSESYLVPIKWTKYLSVLTIISTRQYRHCRPHSFSKLRRNTEVGHCCRKKKLFFLTPSFLEHLTESLLIFWSLSTLKVRRRRLLSWIWVQTLTKDCQTRR